MAIIAFINQKGGVSKSTSAVHLARWLNRKGHTVGFIDCDSQNTSSAWLGLLDDCPAGKVWQIDDPDQFVEASPAIAADYDYVIVDGAGGLSEMTRAILLRTHLALVPLKASGVDLRSSVEAIRLIKQAQSVRDGKPIAALFLTMAVKGSALKKEAIEALDGSDLPLLKTSIHQRQCIADSFGQSSTVFDMVGRAPAESAREFDQLFTEAIALL
jgi:chromosome partitioning protein